MIDHAVDALATARLTRLIIRDKITAPLRGEIVKHAYLTAHADDAAATEALLAHAKNLNDWADLPLHDDDAPNLAAFIVCPWCVSIYVAAGVIAARRVAPGLWSPIARLLAFSEIASVAAVKLDE